MGKPISVDVLVVGSGASGLAAAVSAERAGARVALAAKGSIKSCNSAKAQGGIQAAFGEDDSPEIHAEDVWKSSHETANMDLVRVLTSEAPGTIHWLEDCGVDFTRENGGYRIARCGGASRKRLLQVGDRTGLAITTALRETLTELQAVTEAHLAHEEAAVEQLMLDKADDPVVKDMGRKFGKVSPVVGGTFFAWVRDGASPDELAAIERDVPKPVLVLIGGIFGRGYRKNVAPVWAR